MVIFLGLIASVLVVALAFTLQRRNIIIVSMLLAVVVAVQYLLLGRGTAATLNLVTLAYGVLTFYETRYPWLKSNLSLILLGGAYSGVFFLLNGVALNLDVLAYIASITGVIVMGVQNQIAAKYLMLINGVTWTAYQLGTGAYGQLPGEVFYTVGVIISLVILYRAQGQGKDLNEIPELGRLLLGFFMRRYTALRPSKRERVHVG